MENLAHTIAYSKRCIMEYANDQVRRVIYMIGEYLNKNPNLLGSLYEFLYQAYGNTIVFSKRSLFFSKIFYQKYHTILNLIPKTITWNQCVTILRKNNPLSSDIYVFGVIELFSLNEKEIDYFLETGNVKFILEDIELNNITLEFMNL